MPVIHKAKPLRHSADAKFLRKMSAIYTHVETTAKRVLYIATAALVLSLFLYVITFADLGLSPEQSDWGQFGDYLGGTLNPVFGFLTLMALLATIRLQAKELEATRAALAVSQVEVALSRKAQTDSAEALKLQNEAISKQSFEQTFFTWLGTYREVLGRISIDGLAERRGLDRLWDKAFNSDRLIGAQRNEPYLALHFAIHKSGLKHIDEATQQHFPAIARGTLLAWDHNYVENESQLDSLFRILYRLYKWIDEQPEGRLSREDKWLYTSIIRSQFSWIEMVFLFYNGMTDRGKKFKALINKYAVFDNFAIHRDKLLLILKECPMDSEGYAPEAFDSDVAKEALGIGLSAIGQPDRMSLEGNVGQLQDTSKGVYPINTPLVSRSTL
jgi:hypothetical protein